MRNEKISDDEEIVVSEEEDDDKKEKKEFHVIKSYTDIQRIKLDKLMANPDKPVRIPERPVDREVNRAPEFNHNVMGSSAGAGSGEFHLYRQMRRKERSRVAQLAYRRKRDELDEEFKQTRDENERLAAEKTEKKRLKRQKAKEKKKGKKKKTATVVEKESTASESDSDVEEAIEEKASKAPAVVVDPLMQEPPKKDPLIIYYN